MEFSVDFLGSESKITWTFHRNIFASFQDIHIPFFLFTNQKRGCFFTKSCISDKDISETAMNGQRISQWFPQGVNPPLTFASFFQRQIGVKIIRLIYSFFMRIMKIYLRPSALIFQWQSSLKVLLFCSFRNIEITKLFYKIHEAALLCKRNHHSKGVLQRRTPTMDFFVKSFILDIVRVLNTFLHPFIKM